MVEVHLCLLSCFCRKNRQMMNFLYRSVNHRFITYSDSLPPKRSHRKNCKYSDPRRTYRNAFSIAMTCYRAVKMAHGNRYLKSFPSCIQRHPRRDFCPTGILTIWNFIAVLQSDTTCFRAVKDYTYLKCNGPPDFNNYKTNLWWLAPPEGYAQ